MPREERPQLRRADARLQVLEQQLSAAAAQPSARGAVVCGGIVLDIQATPEAGQALLRGSSVPGQVRQVPGGVARNIAHALAQLTAPETQAPVLLSVVGDDAAGQLLLQSCHPRLDTSQLQVLPRTATPCVAVVLDSSGEVAACVADVAAVEAGLTPLRLTACLQPLLPRTHLLVLEANLPPASLAAAAAAARAVGVPVLLEPVSVPKAGRAAACLHHVTLLTPNAQELVALAGAVQALGPAPTGQEPQGQQGQEGQQGQQGQEGSRGQGLSRVCLHGAPMMKARVGLREEGQSLGVHCPATWNGQLLELGLPAAWGSGPVLGPGMCGSSALGTPAGVGDPEGVADGSCSHAAAPTAALDALISLAPHAYVVLSRGAACIVLTLGALGAALISLDTPCSTGTPPVRQALRVSYMPALPATVLNLSGAGDSLVGGLVAALIAGMPAGVPAKVSLLEFALAAGMTAAQCSVRSPENVPSNLDMGEVTHGAKIALQRLYRGRLQADPSHPRLV